MTSKRRWCCGTFPGAAHDPDCAHVTMLARVAPHLLSDAERRQLAGAPSNREGRAA